MVRLVIAAGIGPPAALLTGALLSRGYAPAVGWDAAALTYCAVVWIVIWPMDAAATAALAKAEDPNRAIADLLTLIACVASLVAVGVVLVVAHSARGAAAEALAGLSLAGNDSFGPNLLS